MNLKAELRHIIYSSIIFLATASMLTVMSEPVAKAEPQGALVAVPLLEALVKAAPSIGSFFQKLFPDPKQAKPSQNKEKDAAAAAQDAGKKQLEVSVMREEVLAKVLRASSSAAIGTAAMAQLVRNHTTLTDGERVDLRQMWSDVSNKLKSIAKAAPKPEIFEAGSPQKLALADVIDYSGSMPDEVLKEIEGKDAANCQALQKSLADLANALQRLSNAGDEELNVIAASLAALTLPQGQHTLDDGKKKAGELGSKAFVNMQALD